MTEETRALPELPISPQHTSEVKPRLTKVERQNQRRGYAILALMALFFVSMALSVGLYNKGVSKNKKDIQTLACTVVAFFPPGQGGPFIELLRTQYDCDKHPFQLPRRFSPTPTPSNSASTPGGKKSSPVGLPPPGGTRSTGVGGGAPGGQNGNTGSNGANPAPGSSGAPRSTFPGGGGPSSPGRTPPPSTSVPHQPPPTKPPPKPTPTPSPPPILPVGDLLCTLFGVCI